MLALRDPYTAYCVDAIVYHFGTSVEDAVQEASASQGKRDTDKKRQMRANSTLRRMLGQEPKFADASALVEKAKKEAASSG